MGKKRNAFQPAPNAVVEHLFADGQQITFLKKESIPTDGSLFLIKSGYVCLFEQSSKRAKKILFIFKPGEFFPFPYQKFLVSNSLHLTYGAISIATLIKIPLSDLDEKIFPDPHKSKALTQELSELFVFVLERLGNIENPQVIKRLVSRLLFFSRRVGISEGKRLILAVPLTHSDIALSIGTSRETVNRLMRGLEKKGLIEVKEKNIVLNDPEKLGEILKK